MTFCKWLTEHWQEHKEDLPGAFAYDLQYVLDMPSEMDSLAWLKHLIRQRGGGATFTLCCVAEMMWKEYQRDLAERKGTTGESLDEHMDLPSV